MSRGYLIKNYYSNTDEKSINLSGHDVITSTLDKHYDDLIEHFYFYNDGQTGRINHYMNKDVMLKKGVISHKQWLNEYKKIPCKIIKVNTIINHFINLCGINLRQTN